MNASLIPINSTSMNSQKLLASWIKEYSNGGEEVSILNIRRAEPRFVYHNYFARFKVIVAKLDGTGQNPVNINCFVVEISETDQTARIEPSTKCDSIHDL
jgi:hypothetical protein